MPQKIQRDIEWGQLVGGAVREVSVSEDGALPEWIHIFPNSSFYNSWLGMVVDVDDAYLQSLVRNFETTGLLLVVDYDHQSVMDTTAPAAGWCDRMEIRPGEGESDGGIWAHVQEWTPRGSRHLEEKEYRYLSPTWFLSGRDRKTGEEIGPAFHSVALTNTPDINTLNPLSSQRRPHAGDKDTDAMPFPKALLAKMGLPDDADEATVAARIDELAKAALDSPPREQPDLSPRLAAIEKAITVLAAQASDDTDKADAVRSLAKAEAEALEAKIDLRLERDRVAPALRASHRALLLQGDEETYQQLLKSSPRVPSSGQQPPSDQGGNAEGRLTPEEAAVAKKFGLSAEKMLAARRSQGEEAAR